MSIRLTGFGPTVQLDNHHGKKFYSIPLQSLQFLKQNEQTLNGI